MGHEKKEGRRKKKKEQINASLSVTGRDWGEWAAARGDTKTEQGKGKMAARERTEDGLEIILTSSFQSATGGGGGPHGSAWRFHPFNETAELHHPPT